MLGRCIAKGQMKERKAFLMRIDPKLWEELEAWAQDELRSVNGQIEIILRHAVQKRRGADSKQAAREKPRSQERPPLLENSYPDSASGCLKVERSDASRSEPILPVLVD